MANRVEEIVLDPNQDDGQTTVLLQNGSDIDTGNEQQRYGLKRLVPLTHRKNLYKNLLLWVILLGVLFLFACTLALHVSYALPVPKSRTIPLSEFSEERARDYYPNLTRYGPRVSNTRADYLTRDFLISQLFRIRSMVKSSVKFEISLQNYIADGITNLQNIAVRLSGLNTTYNTPCVLLCAHYDTVEFSPGGVDDGSGTVVLLEILTNLVNDPTLTFSEIQMIILFSSAEEMNLNGAEAFVRYHNWTSNVRRFINIDSSGSAGKAILFRVKPSQLIYDYKHVPRPHANVIGDEILGMTGSTTDFEIFTAKGSLLGYDFAIYLDGYYYHTPQDKVSRLDVGALQHLGENTFELCRTILRGQVDLHVPETITDEDNVIYFDVLGRRLIAYTQSTSIIIQSILITFVILTGIAVIIIDHLWYNKNTPANDYCSVYNYFKHPLILRLVLIIIFFIGYILSCVLAVALSLIIALITAKVRPLSYYGKPSLAVFLYGLPFIIGLILCEILWLILRQKLLSKYPKKNPDNKYNINHIERICLNFERHWALLLVYVLLMSISLSVTARSLYFILLWSIFICPIYLVIILSEFILRWFKKKTLIIYNEFQWYWLLAPYIVSFVPLIHTLEMASRLLRLAIPIMGRALYSTPLSQDLFICVAVAIPTILVLLVFIPNIQRAMYFKGVLVLLTVSFSIVFIVSLTSHPYNETHPKLIYARHFSLSVYKVTNLTNSPTSIRMVSQKADMTVVSFDRLDILPTLKEISSQTGFALINVSCAEETNCSFTDTTNRTKAYQDVELTSWDSSNNYRFTIRHVPSYQINVYLSNEANFIVHNATMKPRSETVIDVRSFNSSFRSFNLTIKLNRCDVNDSPYLVSLFQKLPHIVTWGDGRCHTLQDTLLLTFNV